MWTCAVCGGDGQAVMMSCPNKCRICVTTCKFLEVPRHVCINRSELFKQLGTLGARKDAFCLPDCGRGRKKWEAGGLTWGDKARTFFGVRDCAAIADLVSSNTDPLKNSDVVVLSV